MNVYSAEGLLGIIFGLLGLSLSLNTWGDENTKQPQLETRHLEQAIEQAKSMSRLHSLQVSRKGALILEYVAEGQRLDQPSNIKSLSKTIVSALVGIAIERRVIDGVEQAVTSLLKDRVPEEADPRINEITVGHLLSMQAGLERTSGPNYGRWVASDNWVAYTLSRPFVDAPGGRMLYSTGNTHLLSAALTDSSGQHLHSLAQNWLGEPLGISIPPWTRDPQGLYFGGNEMAVSPRALIEFAELYLQRGEVDAEQVIPEAWIEASWQPRTRSEHTNDQYGYGWFITELSGQDVYYGYGFAGQMLYVIPELDMAVAMTSDPTPPSPGRPYRRQLEELVADLLIPAVQAH